MPTLQPNDTFAGHYLLKELIGRGGFSEVWKTEDLMADGVIEAIKIYAPESGMDEIGIKQFKNEYITIRSLDHQHLMQVYRFDIYNGIPFLVMPYMEKGSLSRLLYEKGSFSETEIALLMKQVGSALDYLHTRQSAVLHQDIKPDNVLVTNEGSYKLTDFGISSRTRNTLRKVTGHKQAMALAYAPPERFAARPICNEAGDIFSLGVTLYELCTGEVPWMGNGGLGLLQGAEVPDLPPTFSRILNNIIKACLSLDWEHRPTAKQLEQEGIYFLENDSWRPYGSFAPHKTIDVPDVKDKTNLKPAFYTAVILFIIAAALFYPNLKALNSKSVIKSKVASPGKGPIVGYQEPLDSIGTKIQAVILTSSDTLKKEVVDGIENPKPPTDPRKKATETTKVAKTSTKEEKGSTKTKNKTGKKAPSFDKPETLGDYLKAVNSKSFSTTDRKKWRNEAAKMFAKDAIIYNQIGETIIQQYNVTEFLSLLLNDNSIKNLRIKDPMEEDATGKVKNLYLQIEHH
ncbi:hypothetical protein AAE02nite_18300 [Adhaeribacter aerolatus]|uniref:Protein kinase domain-containing protein n=1 Tax=Adhaeribacter aerolatus TaxID=670289 RepID=A0A512AWS2_9BACT|nr:serine/threonine-protein kinase [Adhaeribacter aerolatus]GEO04166.1 hypothetical protein AAE02nite_18300 [Adhaeribacter aerolatus]